MGVRQLQERIASVNDLLCTLNLLLWDSRTVMPAGGTESRGHQIATLTRLARDTLVADETLRLLDAAEREVEGLPADADAREAVRQVRHAVDLHRRIPAALIERRAAIRASANAAWIEARAKGDFMIFQPWLAETVSNARAYADAIGWSAHPYDAMLSLYEPGATVKSLTALFADLKAGLTPILAKAVARPRPAEDVLRRSFPVTDQIRVATTFAGHLGYDLDRGRLDTTVHPFEISFTRNDVRITTRYNDRFLRPALFGAMHETGHAMYEQNIDPAFTRTVFATDLVGLYAVGGTSFGAHESQSRLWENHIGRSRTFWRRHYGDLQAAFPQSLGDVDVDGFYRAITTVTPGLIRVDADELTYDFHIMLRVELEAKLMAGEVAVADIPAVWNAAMKDQLGLDVPNDREGCLQDIHWSSGTIGSFCCYTIGNVMAAQLFETAVKAQGMEAAIAAGDYVPLADWLRERIWRHGRRRTREDMLVAATGRPLEAGPYLAYLAGKYGE